MSRQDKYKKGKILEALQDYYDLNQKKENGGTLSFQDTLKLAYLQVFFKNIVDGEVSDFEKCSKTDYECFREEYQKAKILIERETGKYNIIISKYLELVDKSIYNYSDNDDAKKFEKYIKYLSRKIKTLMNQTSLNRTLPDASKPNEFLTDLFKPIPNTFRLSDIKDFAEEKVKPENFSRFTPDQIESISPEKLKTLTDKQLPYINADGWDRLGTRVNEIDIAKLKKVNSKGMYKQLNTDKLQHLFNDNPYKYIEEFDGPLLDRLTVDFDSDDSTHTSHHYVGGADDQPSYTFKPTDTDLLLKFLRKITRNITDEEFKKIIGRADKDLLVDVAISCLSNNKNVTKVLQKVGKIAKTGATAVGVAALPVVGVVAAAKAIKNKMNNDTNEQAIDPQAFINNLDNIANSASIVAAMKSTNDTSEQSVAPQNDRALKATNQQKGVLGNNRVAPIPDPTNETNTNSFMTELETKAEAMGIITGISRTRDNKSTDKPRNLSAIPNDNKEQNEEEEQQVIDILDDITNSSNARQNAQFLKHSVQATNQQKGVLGNNRVAPIPDPTNETNTNSFMTELETKAEAMGIITGISRTRDNKSTNQPSILNNARNKDIADRGFAGILDIKQENGATDDDEEENDTNNVIEKLGNLAEAAGIITGISRPRDTKSTNQTRNSSHTADDDETGQIQSTNNLHKEKGVLHQTEFSSRSNNTQGEKLSENQNNQQEEESEDDEDAEDDETGQLPITDYSKRKPAIELRQILLENQNNQQEEESEDVEFSNTSPAFVFVNPLASTGGAPSKDNSRTLVSKEMKKNESTGTDFRDDLENWIDFYKEDKVKTEIEKFRQRIESFKAILEEKLLETNQKSYKSLPDSADKKQQSDVTQLYQQDLQTYKKNIEDKLSALPTTNLQETIQKSIEINTNILNQSQFSQYLTDIKYNTFKDNLKNYNRILNKILNTYDEYSKKTNESDIKNIITELKSALNSVTNFAKRTSVGENVDKADSLKTKLEKSLVSIKLGEAEFFKQDKEKSKESSDSIEGELDSVLSKLKKNARSTVSKAVDGSDISSKLTTESLFGRLWKNYLNDLNDENQIIEEAQDKLYRSYKSNNLDPEQALALSQDDKIIFVVIIFVIRQISLAITETMIDYDIITNLYNALISYVGFYALLIILIIIVVNIDDYKLRIVFNFFNMHINQPGIFLHIFILIGLFVLIYMLIKQMYKDIDTDKAKLTEIEKMRLVYRIELMSIFIFVVTSILVLGT
jgi:hypothetical protein